MFFGRLDMNGCRRLFALVWPLALGMANNALMQFVDRVFLAKESEASLAAVLPASMLAVTVIGFFQTLVAYSGTFVAQYHGAGDERGCVRSFRAGFWIALASVAVFVACVPLGRLLLECSGHSAAVMAREKAYFSIVMPGGVALALSMAAGSYFTGRGRTRLVFWVNLLGNALNVALDPLFIFGWGGFPAWGIAGAAAATVIAQAVQAVVLLAFAWRETAHIPSGEGLAPLVRKMLRHGSQSGMHAVLNCLSFTVFVFVTGRLGDTAFAVSNAVFTINYLMYAPMEGFAVGAGVVVGQRMGAGDPEAAYREGNLTNILGLVYIFVVASLAFAFRDPILRMFLASDVPDAQAFLSLGRRLFLLMMAWQVFDAVETTLSGALKGAGDTRFVMWWMLAMAFGFWMPLLYVTYRVCPTMEALWMTMIVYVFLFASGTTGRWIRRRWTHHRLIG